MNVFCHFIWSSTLVLYVIDISAYLLTWKLEVSSIDRFEMAKAIILATESFSDKLAAVKTHFWVEYQTAVT